MSLKRKRPYPHSELFERTLRARKAKPPRRAPEAPALLPI